ncbi:oxidoreductase [Brucella haematophila]|uniref:oxidoreductase n=1 Tax=Brucella haematophila TaxID=419474 RepID=UPI00110D28CC|nr:oxidoreductase [Brucella haematophila]TMV04541.1 SDR family NAD(P)-dependent oxidoreductase [Brucella haematophila]
MSKTWLITGADKGLGYSAAETALKRGDNVVVTVLASDGRHPLSETFPERFRSFHLNAADVARVPEVVAQAEAAFGRIDVLVNNAGYGLISLIEETPPEKYRALFDVNFFGLAEITRAVLPIMRRQRSGHIINLSSVAGFGAVAGFGFYSATKYAVEGLSESLAHEVGPLGIKVTIIEPGPFRSDFAGGSLDALISDNEDYAAAAEYVRTYQTSKHGKQPNDPAKFGPALCKLVDATEPPLRLPLGVEAVAHLRNEMAQVEGELQMWYELASSTSFSS